MDSPRAALRALLAVAGAVLIVGAIVAIRPSLVKKSHPTSSPGITYTPATSVPASSTPTAPTGTAAPASTATASTAPASTVPAPVTASSVPVTTATTTTATTTSPATTAAAGKSPGELARTGISTDPIYLVALMLILGGITLVWMEERLRLLSLIGPTVSSRRERSARRAMPSLGLRRYQPQHSRRVR